MTYKEPCDFVIGSMSLIVVLYRIIFIMIPMSKKSIQEKNISDFFSSLTLLV